MNLGNFVRSVYVSTILGIGMIMPFTATAQNSIAPDSTIYISKPLPTIVIDPGHDNKFTGCYVRGKREEVLTLDVSKKLETLLSKKYNVFLTRETSSRLNINNLDINVDKVVDVKDELLARTNYIKSKNADYSISLHYNATSSSKTNGMEIYFYGIVNPKELDDNKKNFHHPEDCKIYSEKSLAVAMKLSEYAKKNGITSRVYGCDFRLVRTDSTKVSLLVDIGYLTNPTDFKNATTEKGREATAKFLSNFFIDNKEYLDSIVDLKDNSSIIRNDLPKMISKGM